MSAQRALRQRQLARVVLGLAALSASCVSMQSADHEMPSGPDETLLYAEETGSGEHTIVLLPGLLGSTSYWRAARLEAFGADARRIYLDELGFGRSPWPSVDYTLEEHLAAIRRTLVARDATRHVTIVAHSFGTILAAYYAERYPMVAPISLVSRRLAG